MSVTVNAPVRTTNIIIEAHTRSGDGTGAPDFLWIDDVALSGLSSAMGLTYSIIYMQFFAHIRPTQAPQ